MRIVNHTLYRMYVYIRLSRYSRHRCPPHMRRRALAHVQRHQNRQRPDAQPAHESSRHDLVPLDLHSNLYGQADGVNERPVRNGPPPPEPICNGRGDQGPEQVAYRQQAYEEPRAHGTEIVGVHEGVVGAEAGEEIGHGEEAADLAEVIAEY